MNLPFYEFCVTQTSSLPVMGVVYSQETWGNQESSLRWGNEGEGCHDVSENN